MEPGSSRDPRKVRQLAEWTLIVDRAIRKSDGRHSTRIQDALNKPQQRIRFLFSPNLLSKRLLYRFGKSSITFFDGRKNGGKHVTDPVEFRGI
jgi:hypothetical protein